MDTSLSGNGLKEKKEVIAMQVWIFVTFVIGVSVYDQEQRCWGTLGYC